MAKASIKAGSTSQTREVFIQDSSSTTGAGLTGLVFNSSGLTAYYVLNRAASAAITLATLAAATSAWSSGGFKEIDATNCPGLYRFDIPDAALASGNHVVIYFRGATNMAPLPLEIELTAVDNQSATAFMTGVNSLAPPTNWNLDSIDSNGRRDVIKLAGTTQTARDIGASVLLSTGTGTGQLDFTSGVVKSNATQFAGQTITAAAGVTLPSSVASPTNITAGTITTATNLTTNNDKTGYGLSAAAVQAIWDALTSALTTVGSIGKKLADWTIGTAQTGDSFARLGAPVAASISADIAGVQSDTDNIQTRLPAALVSGRMDSSVGAYPGNTVQTGDNYARLGAPAGASVSVDIAAVKVDTAAIKAKTDNLPSDPADASDIASSFSTVNSTLSTIAGYIDTEVAAIKAKTDNLPSDPADASDIAGSFSTVNSTLSTIAGYIDTEVAAIKAKTDNLPASPAAVGDIPTAAANAAAVGARTATESYATDGAVPTYDQFLFMIWAALAQFAVAGTTISAKKLDGTTQAMAFTIDDATAPTSRTRTT